MSRKKKWLIYTICAFIILSIYKDLTRVEDLSTPSPSIQNKEETDKIYAVKRTVRRGDTLLSIMEEIHGGATFTPSPDTFIHDFKAVNDGVDPYQLSVQQSYYFPLYKH